MASTLDSAASPTLRVAFIGNAAGIGHAVALSGHRLVAVAQRPVAARPLARAASLVRRRLRREGDPLADLARDTGAALLPWTGVGEGDFADELARTRPDVLVCAGWPRRLGPRVLAAAPRGAFNVHPSLLPRGRGPNPCAWTLLAGESVTGVTVHRMTARFDDGPIVAQRELAVLPTDTQGSLLGRCLVVAIELVPGVLDALAADSLPETPQDPALATAQSHPRVADFLLDFGLPARALHDRIRAALPAPGATARLGGRRIRVIASVALDRPARARPGTIEQRAGQHLCVATGDGSLLLTVDRRSALGLRVGGVLSSDDAAR